MAFDHDALIVIDVQNDFCPGGALAVVDGDAIVPVVNRLIARSANVILTQDWHPAGHLSFASSHPGREPFQTIEADYGPQILWPDHCVQESHGAAFHKDLNVTPAHMIVRKGFRPRIDSYSAFFENDHRTPTGLAGYLRERGLNRLLMVGLATDFCVGFSALDARRLEFQVAVAEDGCRAIDLDGSLGVMKQRFLEAGVRLVASRDI